MKFNVIVSTKSCLQEVEEVVNELNTNNVDIDEKIIIDGKENVKKLPKIKASKESPVEQTIVIHILTFTMLLLRFDP